MSVQAEAADVIFPVEALEDPSSIVETYRIRASGPSLDGAQVGWPVTVSDRSRLRQRERGGATKWRWIS